MGADWVRRSQEKFRHHLREHASDLEILPLFIAEEAETVTIPCHWLREDQTLPVGTRLTLFQRGEKARIAVMHGSLAVAEVRGEAAEDLKELFRGNPKLQNMLPVRIVRVGESTEPFYVQPAAAAKARGASA